MADITKAIVTADGTVTNLIDPTTKQSVNYRPVTVWYDNTPMTNEKCDGRLYRRKGSNYYKQVIDKDGELFIEKDTMAQFRSLSNWELLLVKSGVVKGIRLNGYYAKGDTPAPIEYYLSSTSGVDDGGSIIEIGSIKFEANFTNDIDIRYFGGSDIVESSIMIQNALNYSKSKTLTRVIGSGVFKVDLPVFIECNCNLADATFNTTKNTQGALVNIGNGSMLSYKIIFTPTIVNTTFTTNYTGIESTGLKINGIKQSVISIKRIQGFKRGCYLYSDWANNNQDDITWNKISFEAFINNETQLDMHTEGLGYINQNTFMNLMCSKNSNTERSIDKQLLVRNNATSSTRFDNNTFINCAFEQIVARPDDPNYAVVELHKMTNCVFIGGRYEVYLAGNKILIDAGADNIFIGGYQLRSVYFTFQNNPVVTLDAGSQFYSTGGRTSNVAGNINQDGDISLLNGHQFKTDGAGGGLRATGASYPVIADNTTSESNIFPRFLVKDTTKSVENQFYVGGVLFVRDILTFGASNTSVKNYTGLSRIQLNFKDLQVVDAYTTANLPTTGTQRGTMYFDTTENIPKWYNSGSGWVKAVPNATTTVKGIVNQSAAVANSTVADATDLTTAIALVNDLKAKLNAKLTADRNSGQQA